MRATVPFFVFLVMMPAAASGAPAVIHDVAEDAAVCAWHPAPVGAYPCGLEMVGCRAPSIDISGYSINASRTSVRAELFVTDVEASLSCGSVALTNGRARYRVEVYDENYGVLVQFSTTEVATGSGFRHCVGIYTEALGLQQSCAIEGTARLAWQADLTQTPLTGAFIRVPPAMTNLDTGADGLFLFAHDQGSWAFVPIR